MSNGWKEGLKQKPKFKIGERAFFKPRVRSSVLLMVLSSTVLLAACGTLSNGRGWGQDATILPGWHRVGQAALDAAFSPATWAPAAGALVLQIGDMDERLSDWASDRTPVFGSIDDAKDASDTLRDLALADYLITTLATPSGESPGQWAIAKAKGLAVGYVAIQSTRNATFFLKDEVDRTRPEEDRDGSFPSNHSSKAAVYAMLASRNIDSLSISDPYKTALKVGTFALDIGTAWARVEARRHFPADVLAGMALGHFMGAFFNDAFLGLDQTEQIGLNIEPSRSGVFIAFHWLF